MKKTLQQCFILLTAFLVLGAVACKKKLKDADIQASVESVLSTDPELKSGMVTVQDGVATISGECDDEACRTRIEEAVKKVDGVKSVVNNTTVASPSPSPAIPQPSDGLAQAVADAVKDFPTVTTQLNDGVLTLTGEIKRTELQKLMQNLNALTPMGLKKIETAGLVKK